MTDGKKQPVTPEGFQKLQEELERLWKRDRPKVVRAVGEAAAQGDRSENAEYIYGKKRLREIDHRIRQVQHQLENAMVVRERPGNGDTIYFGAYVRLRDKAGNSRVCRVVGAQDHDGEGDKITLHSPMGRALRGKRAGERVQVALPRGEVELTVEAVQYEPFV